MSHGNRRILKIAGQLTSYEPVREPRDNGPNNQLTNYRPPNQTIEDSIMKTLGFTPEGNRLKKVETTIGNKYVIEGIPPVTDLRQYV